MPPIPYLGEVVSLLTAVCWSTNAVLFAKAGQRVGSPTVNIARLGIALAAMLLLHTLIYGTPFPFQAGSVRLAWLAASGLIGFSLGDALLFEALVLLGPRLAMLIMTLWPVFAALMALAFLGQTMSLPKVVAMLVTLGGIALVVADKGRSSADAGKPRRFVLGVILGIGGAAGQAVGFIFSKFGMAGGMGAISANVVRVSAGFLALGAWQALRGELMPNARKLKDARDLVHRPRRPFRPRDRRDAEPLRHRPRALPGRGFHPHVPVPGDPAAGVRIHRQRTGELPRHPGHPGLHRRGRGAVPALKALNSHEDERT
jgi:drug/metabolite transporter (DMT)-like permease